MTKTELRHILSQHINFTNSHWLAETSIIEIDGNKYDLRSLVLLTWTTIKLSSDKHVIHTCNQSSCCSPGHVMYLQKKYTATHLRRAKAKADRDGVELAMEHLEWAATPRPRVGQKKSKKRPENEAEVLSEKEAARLEGNRRSLAYYRERLAKMIDAELTEYRASQSAKKREALRKKKADAAQLQET